MPAKSATSFHLMGICGKGMGTFAGLLQTAGHEVRGSDQSPHPPMSERLAAWGIEVRSPYAAENLLPPPDRVIVGNVISRDNVEAKALLDSSIDYTSFPAALAEYFLEGRHSVVVSGTHGKTSTTGLLAHTLYEADLDPSFLVGGLPRNFGEGFRLGTGPHFVVEGDEYDSAFFDKGPKFLHYQPQTLICTSLEFDHADIYPDIAAIEAAFAKLFALLPPGGALFVCRTAHRALALPVPPDVAVIRYGVGASADGTEEWWADDLRPSATGTDFVLHSPGAPPVPMFLPLVGRHHVENAVAVAAASAHLGVPLARVAAAFRGFSGVEQRQTVRAEGGGLRLIDDYAHHPSAVKTTLEGLRQQYPKGRLLAAFEPGSATSSRRYFQSAYAEAFGAADLVVIADVRRKNIAAEERLDVAALTAAIGPHAHHVSGSDAIADFLLGAAEPGDTIVVMSNGAFGGLVAKLSAAIETARDGTRGRAE